MVRKRVELSVAAGFGLCLRAAMMTLINMVRMEGNKPGSQAVTQLFLGHVSCTGLLGF
jgi:hypothetical protein